MRLLFILLFSFLSLTSHARLLDKTLAVINDQVITSSQISRVKSNLNARRSISALIYNKSKFSTKELVGLKVQRVIVREKLSEIGFVVTDDQVESQVQSTEKRLGLSRSALLSFLNSNNFTFDEYFELIRETIEYNYFIANIIQPLVSITDQELRNEYYKSFKVKKTKVFNYDIIDYTIPKSKVSKSNYKRLRRDIYAYRKNKVKRSYLRSLDETDLGLIKGDGLSKQIRRSLYRTKANRLSQPVLIDGTYHVFFVRSKESAESDDFLSQKPAIYNSLFEKSITSIQKIWFGNESTKHYIKYFF